MALLELSFADTTELARQGRSFNCVNCPLGIQKVRRCHENRMDFTRKDGSIWPMQIQKGGSYFGFCPAKAGWESSTVKLYRTLVVACEQKSLLIDGGINNQPSWFIDYLSWFAPLYDSLKFSSRILPIVSGLVRNGTRSKHA